MVRAPRRPLRRPAAVPRLAHEDVDRALRESERAFAAYRRTRNAEAFARARAGLRSALSAIIALRLADRIPDAPPSAAGMQAFVRGVAEIGARPDGAVLVGIHRSIEALGDRGAGGSLTLDVRDACYREVVGMLRLLARAGAQ